MSSELLSHSSKDGQNASWRMECCRVAIWGAMLSLLGVLGLAFTSDNPFFLAPFRESQTAITADYLLREPAGGMLAAQLPVLGKPWQVPHELPLIQQVTAWSAGVGIDVGLAGRLVHLLGFGLCVAIAMWLGREWGLLAEERLLLLALLLCSPLYLAYATAHLIESWALLFALLHVAASWKFIRTRLWRWCVVALAAGVLAALIKITTWLPAGVLVGLAGLIELCDKGLRRSWRTVAGLAATAVLVLVIGIIWTRWCAQVRSANVVSEAFQGEAFLRKWVFGTVADRLSPVNWLLAGGKTLVLLFGPLGIAVPPILGLAGWRALKARSMAEARWMLLGALAYLLHLAVFLRLNLRHDYYMYGAGVYLVLALVVALRQLERPEACWPRWLMSAFIVSMAMSAVTYTALKRGFRDFVVERSISAINAVHQPGILVMFGFDWSAQVPFMTGRKAVMLPGAAANERVLRQAMAAAEDTPVAAVVVIGSNYDSLASLAASLGGVGPVRKVQFWTNGYLLVRDAGVAEYSAMTEPPVIRELAARVGRGAEQPNGLIFRGPMLLGHRDGAWEFVVKRGADAFYLRLLHFELVRVRGYFSES